MRITPNLSDEAVLGELGSRLERIRLERNLTQRELAALAGVERKAIQRIESGAPVTMTSLVRIMRALGLTDALEELLPPSTPSPVELLELSGRRRRRASGSRRRPARPPGESTPWRWGDGSPPPQS